MEALHVGVDALRDQEGFHPDQEHEGQQEQGGEAFPEVEVGRGVFLPAFGEFGGGLAEEDAGDGAQSVDGRDEDAQSGEGDDPSGLGPEGVEDGEFAEEVGEAGQADGGHGGGYEAGGQHGRLGGEPAHVGHFEGAGAFLYVVGQQE